MRGAAIRKVVAAGGKRSGELISMEMTGLDEFEDALSHLSHSVSEPAVEKALVAAAEPMVYDASIRARRADTPSKGSAIGHMADSIRIFRLGYMDGALAVAVTYDRDHYWGTFLELGTPTMGAWPFLRPTFDYLGESRAAAFAKNLGEDLEQKVPGFSRSAA